ncbi:MAG: cytochrome c [Acidimicrobiales bacterium]
MTPPQRVTPSVDAPPSPTFSRRSLFVALILALGASLAAATPALARQTATTQVETTDSTDSTATESTATDTTATDEPDPAAEAQNQLLRDGQEVFAAVCQSCHQPGGVGLAGQFPPLKGNTNATDADYVRGVVTNGKSGQLVVNGETYDGVMPPFSTLSEDDISAVVAFVTNDLVAPVAEGAVITPTGPVAGTELPGFTNMTYYLAFAMAAFVLLLVVGPRLASQNDRLDTPWFDVGLKTATIVLGFIIATVFVPNWALNTETVGKLDRPFQDLIGAGLWVGGLGIGLWALWYTHRESRI